MHFVFLIPAITKHYAVKDNDFVGNGRKKIDIKS